jgi:branched-subunit amino acid ABC-type transport system permease component
MLLLLLLLLLAGVMGRAVRSIVQNPFVAEADGQS